MLLEGFFFKKKKSISIDLLNRKYDKFILLENGYLGVKFNEDIRIFPSNFLGVISNSEHEETRWLSDSKTQHFVSFSLEGVLVQQRNSAIGVCAWYDTQVKKLYLSRDVFGLIPFYYFQLSDEIIAFSTDLPSLVANPFVKVHLSVNLQRLALYGTVLAEATIPYTDETFYERVRAVPPGCLVTLDFQAASTRTYTKLSPSKWSNLSRVEEFAEEFRHIFINSIKRNLRPGFQLSASHLSGGMDSSSVSTIIKFLHPEQPLHTLYNKSNTLDTDENLYAMSVAEKIGSVHHEILQSEEDFRLLSTFTALAGQPSSMLISPSGTASLMQFAKDLGCNTIFNGTGGDSIVGSGLEAIGLAFDKRNWSLVKTLARKRASFYSNSHKFRDWENYSEDRKYEIVLNNLFFRKLSQLAFRRNWRELNKIFTEISSNFDISYSYLLKAGGKGLLDKVKKGHFTPVYSILNDDLLALSRHDDLTNITELLENGHSQEQHSAFADIFHTHTIFSNEDVFAISKHYNITNSSPFYDTDLFELCLAVPDVIKFGDGIGRAHFREAMKGLLPEHVRRRSTKTVVRSLGQQIVLRTYQQARDLLMQTSEVWNYVNRTKFEHQLSILKNDRIPYPQKNNTLILISRTISLAIWLEWYKGNK
ncbi:MAG: asparagine synthase-related protein [Dyadobacter sp.]|uniref:asparagine synthase-related protein n=1 Tax=Dyadobacter sp. TaxID=1914288 RepID=UPI00326350C0